MATPSSNAQIVPVLTPPMPGSSADVALALPKMWPGFALATFLMLCELSYGSLTGVIQAIGGRPVSQLPKSLIWLTNPTGPALSLGLLGILAAVAYVGGLVYWFWSVYRIHKILADTTNGSYPISPGKAVGYQLIPFYCIVWNFRWPREIANLVNGRTRPGAMSKYWPGIFLLAASVLGSIDDGLQLLALFGIGLFLTRKLAQVDLFEPTFRAAPDLASARAMAIVSAPAGAAARPSPQTFFERWALAVEEFDWSKARELRLSLAACSGATFGFLACYGLWTTIQQVKARDFSTWDLLVIAMIAFLLWQFVEPLFDLMKDVFTGKRNEDEDESFSKRSLIFLAFVAIVVASHTLLEKTHEQFPNGETILVALGLTILFGPLTYALIRGTKCGIKEGFKVMAGPVAVALVVGVVMTIGFPRAVLATWAPGPSLFKAAATAAGSVSQIDAGDAVNRAGSLVASGSEVPETKEAEKKVGSLTTGTRVIVPYSIFVFLVLFGFFVFGKRPWGPREMAVCGFLCGIGALAYGSMHHTQNIHLFACLWATTGWCVAVLAFCESDLLDLQELRPALAEGRQSAALPGEHGLVLHQTDSPLRKDGRVRLAAFAVVIVLFVITCVVFARAPKIYITSSADQTTRQYHQPNPDVKEKNIAPPEEGLSVEGSPVIWTDATESSPPDVYTIHVQRGPLKIVRKLPNGGEEDWSDGYMFIPTQGQLRVLPANSAVTIAPQSVTVGPDAVVPLTATVSSTLGAPTGTVTFMDGGTSLGTSSILNGAASLQPRLNPGLHLITAIYNAEDRNFQKATSDAAQVNVVPGFVAPSGASITLTSSTPTAGPDTPVTFVARVISKDNTPPSGAITFKDNSTLLATEPLAGGASSFTTRELRPGIHTITADYSEGGSSNSLTETITMAMVQPGLQVIPAGAPIVVRTIDPVDSATAKAGQIVHASLQAPVALNRAPATLRIIRVDPSGKVTGHSSVTLALESVTIGGRNYPIRTVPVERIGPAKTADAMKKTGIGAAIGGAVGGIFGHGKGAAVGAASGAGAGAALAASSSGGPARIPPETVLTFHLKSSLNLGGGQ